MSSEAIFDTVVLGGGSGGYATALRAAQLGQRVALIERSKLGGTCLHSGCIPTKAMLHSAEIAQSVRDSAQFGISSTIDKIDARGVQAFKDSVVDRLYKGLQGLIGAAPGISYIEGRGVLVDPRTVEVGGRRVTGEAIVVATGSFARTLPNVDLGSRVLTSSEALELSEIPERVVIIGGSVIGVEFASAWRSLGVDVTIVEALPTLVPLEDRILSRQLERAFKKRKIIIRTKTTVAEVRQTDDDVTVVLDDGTVLEADYVLVAVGRVPNTTGLGLSEVGVETDGPWIATDDRLCTSVDGIYAVGDVVRGLQLAHRSFAHGIFVAEEIAGRNPKPVLDSVLPRVTYCEPELASVGLSEDDARATHGDAIKVYEYNLAGNGKSQILQTAGVVKVVEGPDGILGVHMAGSRISEQIGEASLIVGLGLHSDSVAELIHAHPTQNEALGEAFMALAGKPLHTHA